MRATCLCRTRAATPEPPREPEAGCFSAEPSFATGLSTRTASPTARRWSFGRTPSAFPASRSPAEAITRAACGRGTAGTAPVRRGSPPPPPESPARGCRPVRAEDGPSRWGLGSTTVGRHGGPGSARRRPPPRSTTARPTWRARSTSPEKGSRWATARSSRAAAPAARTSCATATARRARCSSPRTRSPTRGTIRAGATSLKTVRV
mmetsp:Transcript_14243/g.60983  ORF Transcript_14243/g.60983 Transcript_14243/m.60983 type:complete len:206 (+) Transcript_14243:3815-4432(+)